MKRIPYLLLVFTFLGPLFGRSRVQAQVLDTVVDVGPYKLHFHLIKGRGTPSLFEAGGGETAAVWQGLLPELARLTGAPLLSYDRAGFGGSTFNTGQHGLLAGMRGLEMALHKLGYDHDIVLVAHFQGGIYAQLYAYRHPHQVQVQGAVLLDVSSICWFAGPRLVALQAGNDREKQAYQATFPGLYYQLADLTANFDYVHDKPFPATFPITDLVAEHPPFSDSTDIRDWQTCHATFVQQATNRTGFTVRGSGHYLYKDNPLLVVSAIAQLYESLLPTRRARVLANALAYALAALNKR